MDTSEDNLTNTIDRENDEMRLAEEVYNRTHQTLCPYVRGLRGPEGCNCVSGSRSQIDKANSGGTAE